MIIVRKLWITILSVAMLIGCGTGNESYSNHSASDNVSTAQSESDNNHLNETEVPNQVVNDNPDNNDNDDEQNQIATKYQINETQLNKIAMLNYLSFLAEEIHGSPNGKLYLDQVINVLLNDFNPSAIDTKTQERINRMVRDVQSLKMTEVKRERLAYIYEQNKSMSLMHALPSPLSILTVVNSRDVVRSLVSVVSMALDAKASYDNYTSQLELGYLQDGWALDDENEETIIQLRTESFNYMVQIAEEYGIKDAITINENSINEFVSWKNNDNIKGRITFLTSNEEQYEMYSGYWLLLSNSYYEDEKYDKCIEAIEKYISIKPSIFRTDSQYASTLPYVIASLPEVFTGDELIKREAFYIGELYKNTKNKDFDLRYFAAITYLDLYAKTEQRKYLETAYEIVKNNVNNYVSKQAPLNKDYVNNLKLKTVSKNTPKAEKKEIETYNNMLKEKRKKELPPVDATLLINAKLMLDLASKLNINSEETATINGIMHNKGEQLFLVTSIDDRLWYGFERVTATVDCLRKPFLGNYQIELPANYVSDASKIVLKVRNQESVIEYHDWKVENVDRHNSNEVKDFTVQYVSPSIGNISLSDGDLIEVVLYPYEDLFEPITTTYQATVKKNLIGSETSLTLVG